MSPISIPQLTYAISKMEECDDNKALLEFNPNNLSPISELTLGSTFDTSTLIESSTNTSSVFKTTTTLTTLVIATTTETSRKKGGRSKGSTVKARTERISKIKAIIVEAATLIINTRQGEADGKLVRHGYKQILTSLEVKHGLEENSLHAHRQTISSHIRNKNPSGLGHTQKSPMLELEPVLVGYVERLSDIRMPLNREGVIDLAISMIAGQPMEEKVIAWKWKKAHCYFYEGQPLLGISWYHRFIQCNSDKLTQKKALIRDVQRETWVTYENFQNMYECVYNQMVIAGVARKLPEKVYYDRDGAIVDEEKAFGLASEYKLLHPEMVVTVNKTGANRNQKSHGHLGGELFVVGSDQQDIGQLGAATNNHFTALVFTRATGEPIMVAVILKLDKSTDMIPLNWSMGLDYLKIEESADGSDLDSIALMQENKDAMCGGPTCVFRG